jgi:hypothetical protein
VAGCAQARLAMSQPWRRRWTLCWSTAAPWCGGLPRRARGWGVALAQALHEGDAAPRSPEAQPDGSRCSRADSDRVKDGPAGLLRAPPIVRSPRAPPRSSRARPRPSRVPPGPLRQRGRPHPGPGPAHGARRAARGRRQVPRAAGRVQVGPPAAAAHAAHSAQRAAPARAAVGSAAMRRNLPPVCCRLSVAAKSSSPRSRGSLVTRQAVTPRALLVALAGCGWRRSWLWRASSA